MEESREPLQSPEPSTGGQQESEQPTITLHLTSDGLGLEKLSLPQEMQDPRILLRILSEATLAVQMELVTAGVLNLMSQMKKQKKVGNIVVPGRV